MMEWCVLTHAPYTHTIIKINEIKQDSISVVDALTNMHEDLG